MHNMHTFTILIFDFFLYNLYTVSASFISGKFRKQNNNPLVFMSATISNGDK